MDSNSQHNNSSTLKLVPQEENLDLTELSDSQLKEGNSTIGSKDRVISPHTVICTDRELQDPRQEIIKRLE